MGTAESPDDAIDRATLRRFTAEKLRSADTYLTALVVGALINLYGQILVPWLRGTEDPWQHFFRECVSAPGLSALSVGAGFVFPFLVGVYSSVTTRWALIKQESNARGGHD